MIQHRGCKKSPKQRPMSYHLRKQQTRTFRRLAKGSGLNVLAKMGLNDTIAPHLLAKDCTPLSWL